MATGRPDSYESEPFVRQSDDPDIPALIGPFLPAQPNDMKKRPANSVNGSLRSLFSGSKGSHCSCKSSSVMELKLRAQKAKLKATHAAQLQQIVEKTVNLEAERKKQEARQAVEEATLEADFLLNFSQEEDRNDEDNPGNNATNNVSTEKENVMDWVMQQPFDNVPHSSFTIPNTTQSAQVLNTVENSIHPQPSLVTIPSVSSLYSRPVVPQTQVSTTTYRPVTASAFLNRSNQQPYDQAPVFATTINNVPEYPPQRHKPMNKPIDSWIDSLVLGQETNQSLRSSLTSTNQLTEAIVKLESERDLPKLELPTFDGSPVLWPKFIEQFYTHVHHRPGIADTRRLDILLSHLRGDAKNLVQGLGYTGRNYCLALQELKATFGHPIKVARAFVEQLTCGSTIPNRDPAGLRQFYILVRDCIATLQQMNYYSDLYSSDTLIKATKRIPLDRVQSWNEFSKHILRSREPNLLDLKDWLKERLDADLNPYAVTPHKMDMNRHDMVKSKFSLPRSNTIVPTKHRTFNSRTQFGPKSSSSITGQSQKLNVPTTTTRVCSLCQNDHYLFRCPVYWNKSVQDRKQIVLDKNLCLNCLRSDHKVDYCSSSLLCREPGCNGKHHTSLHSSEFGQNPVVHKLQTANEPQVCFQIAKIQVFGKNNQCVETYALLDTASEITLIQDELAQYLGVSGKQKLLTIQTINGETTQNSSKVSFSVKSATETNGEILNIPEAWTVPNDVFQCPPQVIQPEWQHLAHLGLEDVMSSQVKILLGANIPGAHLQLDIVVGQRNQPVGIRTMLGWSLMGVALPQNKERHFSVNLLCKRDRSLLEQTVEHFWKTESFGAVHTANTPLSTEDRKSQKLLEQTTQFVNGHYQVGMLWRDPNTIMPNNYYVALRRFELLTRRLIKDKEFREKYSQTLNSYIKNGYARKLSHDEASTTSRITWYIPHHGVTNPNKPGRVRPVFDAAALYQGTSLNNHLMTGPDLLNNLFGILLRFRLYRIALVADVEAMFHQVGVPDEDTDALRFLWKEDIVRSGAPDVYKMTVHIFGAADSPSCANYAMKRTATDKSHQFAPTTVETVLQDFYVDDLLKSVETTSEAVQLYKELTTLLSFGGFRLHKWMSSSLQVLDAIPQSERAVQELNLDLDDLPIQRTLGLRWRVQSDTFHFNPTFRISPATKRSIVSTVSSIFDPCGFLAPFTFRAKCIIQDIWRCGCEWDESLPSNLQREWGSWHQELDFLNNFTLPRHHQNYSNSSTQVEIHLFSDASEKGFGSVAYLKYLPPDCDITCSFLASKTRVAPNKPQLSIPRLELQAAVLSVRLWITLKKELSIPLNGSFFWTDSTTVLQYINNKTKRFKPFVSNRVAEILDNTTPDQWFHVPTTNNPADYCSRGLPASKLTVSHPWFKGPLFLWNSREIWPSQSKPLEPDVSDPEVKISCLIQKTEKPGNLFLPSLQIAKFVDPKKFSTWLRLARHSAWVIRAIRNFMVPIRRLNLTTEISEYLLPNEYENAILHWTKQAQEDSFPKEMECLKANKDLPVQSPLLPLTPTYDDHHLRVGGRLRKANIPVETKSQIILPKNHVVTNLLLYEAHLNTAHGGVEHMIADIRRRFWPVSVRRIAKKINRDCFLCKLRRASPKVPRIADLPTCRMDCLPGPFFHTGIDYFGPMHVTVGRKTHKRWGCLFTCMSTRAVHLELADSLDADDFIMVLRKFLGRRGNPKHIYSDNGTNFVGADNELKAALKKLQLRIGEFLAPKGIYWHFNPPLSPHFGGAWERLIRCTKIALNAVLGARSVQESVLRTAIIEVEAVLNSRPLTYNSCDSEDFTALTPNHFLIGRANYSTCPCEVVDKEINSRRRWKRVQVIANHVCNRFLKEYLPTLSIRHKWKVEQPNLHIGDLVLIVEDNQPRGSWLLGRIVDVMPGDDGRIRSIKVKTPKGTIIRPSAKICLLEEDVRDK